MDRPVPDGAAQRLPPEVLDCIAQHLRRLHIDSPGESCESCALADLTACARTCRNWRDGICPNLYTRICIAGAETPGRNGTRILQLQRTLAARPDYSAAVRELTLPEYSPDPLVEKTIAGLIMRCPNLERMLGPYPALTTGPDSVVHTALSTRTKLKEHLWLLNLAAPMQYRDSEAFIRLHQSWQSLDTLVLHGGGSGGGGGISSLAISDLLPRLPALRSLMVSRLQDYEFDDNALAALPRGLTQLRLEELPGTTERGLLEYLARPGPAVTLTTLCLVDLELLLLSTISTIFTTLTKLKRFTLLQTAAPQPSQHHVPQKHLLASKSLEYLHWDPLVPGPATLALSLAIHRQCFPALRSVRAPSDHHGLLQAVCRPRASILQPRDPRAARENTSYSRRLPCARLAAEARIVEARSRVFMNVVLTPPASPNDEGKTVRIGGFMGSVGSAVEYGLRPDVRGSWEALVRVADFGKRFQGDGCGERGVCTGGLVHGGGRGGGHTERPRRREEEMRGLGFLF
ncbi:hypothetical protein EDC01DRAFT_617299 [Geopyxis carbonaria]|nr:hypothetical protein EDC01DRAFT_617299 [Geopyxis carbonaria]